MKDSSFSSIDRLMEFGLGLGIAQQMVNTMNQVINTMNLPNAGQALKAVKNDYYAVVDAQRIGPLSEEEIFRLIANGSLTENTFVWKYGMSGWKMVKDIPELLKHIILNRK